MGNWHGDSNLGLTLRILGPTLDKDRFPPPQALNKEN